MTIFDVNNPFWQFLNKMTDQFLLSLLWLACSIPLVTFGASTTAFFSVSMRLHEDLEGSLLKEFFQEFRRCFKRSTGIWLVQLAVFALVAVDLWVCCKMDRKIGWFLVPVIATLGVLLLVMSLFTWPLASRSSAPLRKLWMSARYTTISYLQHGISMLLMAGLAVVIADLLPYAAPVLPSVVCYQYARIYVWVFHRDLRVQAILDGGEPQDPA